MNSERRDRAARQTREHATNDAHERATNEARADATSASPSPATDRSKRTGVRVRRRMTPDQLPLWRDVMTMQQQLRPEAIASVRAGRRPEHPVRAVIALCLTVAVIVVWSVQLQSDKQLPRVVGVSGLTMKFTWILQGVTNEHIAQAWMPITGALGAGAVTYLLLLVVPASRRFARRHPVVPVALGAMVILSLMQIAK